MPAGGLLAWRQIWRGRDGAPCRPQGRHSTTAWPGAGAVTDPQLLNFYAPLVLSLLDAHNDTRCALYCHHWALSGGTSAALDARDSAASAAAILTPRA